MGILIQLPITLERNSPETKKKPGNNYQVLNIAFLSKATAIQNKKPHKIQITKLNFKRL